MQETNLTPAMRQYMQMKAEAPQGAVLLFRMGDFYEMFYEDAHKASPILEITLTKRAGYPMCGIPYHALDSYLPKLLEAGVKVAIAEQLEDPALAKGIVKRGITRIITPGTVLDSSVLNPQGQIRACMDGHQHGGIQGDGTELACRTGVTALQYSGAGMPAPRNTHETMGGGKSVSLYTETHSLDTA